jgi:glutamine kinase
MPKITKRFQSISSNINGPPRLNKAETLESLTGVLKSATVLPLFRINYADWRVDPTSVVLQIKITLGGGPYIVRSCANSEDVPGASNAGVFLSVTQVRANGLPLEINRVFGSYGIHLDGTEIFVQPYLDDTSHSGVIFTHDVESGAPYRSFSWTDSTDTSLVTQGGHTQTWISAFDESKNQPDLVSAVYPLVNELLMIYHGSPLDIEFGAQRIKNNIKIYLFQVRSLKVNCQIIHPQEHFERTEIIQQRIARNSPPIPGLLGNRTFLGVMPDWNPAEIIGRRPRPLALSLYQELITDSIWAFQRHNYGYRNLRSFPLMTHIFGQPYIDVRVSFNSFIPQGIEDNLGHRLVNFYLDELESKPWLHDKIEFQVAITCFTPSIDARLSNLLTHGFSIEDCQILRSSLLRLTNSVLHPNGRWTDDQDRMKRLISRRKLHSRPSNPSDLLHYIYWQIEDCKRYGTLPFSGLARAAFISVETLNSLVKNNYLDQAQFSSFMSNLWTVSSQLKHAMESCSRENFLEKFGHLRPGTYDILSRRYDEAADDYFDWLKIPNQVIRHEEFQLSASNEKAISEEFSRLGMDLTCKEFFNVAKMTIELREQCKFEFTRNLSNAISAISEYGNHLGLSDDELSYSQISDFLNLYRGTSNPQSFLRNSVENGRSRFAQTLSISLPHIIMRPADVEGWFLSEIQPNFVTRKSVIAQVSNSLTKHEIRGKIVFIESADPGYDWIFSHDIAGLVTAWGGMNSHMAIRASEIGVPAVIGAGEQNYKLWGSAARLSIDCGSGLVNILT